jgi:hypothetical protein
MSPFRRYSGGMKLTASALGEWWKPAAAARPNYQPYARKTTG